MRRKYTKELLEPLVKDSKSMSDVLRKLELSVCGSAHTHVSKRVKDFDIDTSHFNSPYYGIINSSHGKQSADEILVRTDRREKASRLRRALLEKGRQYICVVCDNPGQWMGKSLQLEIDHIDSDFKNNLEENLQFLCPNCHGQKTLGV